MKETTMTVYTTRSILQFTAYCGVDPEEVCAAAGLEPDMLKLLCVSRIFLHIFQMVETVTGR